MKQGLGKYAMATTGVVLVVGALLSLRFREPAELLAIATSGAVAIAIQLSSFSLGRMAGANNLVARMGTGAMMRLFTVIIYAFIVAKLLPLPLTAALVSIAAFFFLSTLIEPLLIKS